MKQPLEGTYIPKGTPARKCPGCNAPVYRRWWINPKNGQNEFRAFSCEGDNHLAPTERLSGIGIPHVCAKESAA